MMADVRVLQRGLRARETDPTASSSTHRRARRCTVSGALAHLQYSSNRHELSSLAQSSGECLDHLRAAGPLEPPLVLPRTYCF